jgi:NAD(P)-dependent dehydrogenase (short-subunit alcohol dehydrogenase family)
VYDLRGKVAVVTGAGRHGGIGAAIARRFVSEGAKVVMTDIGAPKGERFGAEHIGTAAELQSIVDEINAGGGEAVAAVCDVRDEVQVQGAIDTAIDRYGSLDVMVNNAGVGYIMSSTLKLTPDDWDAVLEVNLRGAFFGIKHAAKRMIAQGGGGRIISIASQAAKRGFETCVGRAHSDGSFRIWISQHHCEYGVPQPHHYWIGCSSERVPCQVARDQC